MEQILYKLSNNGASGGPIGRKSKSIPRTRICSSMNESLSLLAWKRSGVVDLPPNGAILETQPRISYKGMRSIIHSGTRKMTTQFTSPIYQPNLLTVARTPFVYYLAPICPHSNRRPMMTLKVSKCYCHVESVSINS